MTILFLCSLNKKRSPTCEEVALERGLKAFSAGVDPRAEYVVGQDDIISAETIICMEKRHYTLIQKRFGALLADKKIHVWNIR